MIARERLTEHIHAAVAKLGRGQAGRRSGLARFGHEPRAAFNDQGRAGERDSGFGLDTRWLPPNNAAMLMVHVHVHVKPEWVEAFRRATLENARQSVQEPGIARFDVAQQSDDPTRFVLVECYRSLNAPAQHKETAHYAKWREVVAPMMAEPRTSVKFANVYPDEPGG